MKKAVIGVTPLWDRDRDSYWMLPGYLEGLELAGAVRQLPGNRYMKL